LQKIIVLKEIFGFDTFRNGQEEIIDSMNNYENVLAVMPTGGGKSLCYQLPAVIREGTALVISPLIALMRDQVRSLTKAGVAAASLHSQSTDEEISAVLAKARSAQLKMLYVAPERLGSIKFINLIRSLKVSLVIVDEAHCISQWGFDFRPDYLKIGSLRRVLGDVQIAAFTATADPETQRDIVSALFTKKPKIFVNGFDRPNIRLSCKFKDKPRFQLLDFIQNYKNQSGIVYCSSRAKTEVLAKALNDNGYKSAFYHAGMTSDKRKRVEDQFQSDCGRIVCATVAFGMGIDKPDIRYVVHADLPKSIENFYQEIGRAGRDGLKSESLLLYNLNDVRFRRMQIDESSGTLERKISEHGRLNSLLGFVESKHCRRSKILEYFERKSISSCQNCDLCTKPPITVDATDWVRKLMTLIALTEESFGTAHLINILRGVGSDKVINLSHDQLPTFGSGSNFSEEYWQSIILQLAGLDFIRPSPSRHGAFYLTDKSLPVLKGESKVTLKKSEFDKKTKERQNSPPRALIVEEDEALFVAVRKKRHEIATSLNLPAYFVCSDRTLIEMVNKKPKNLDQMHLINGIGKKKLKKFGSHFLEVINGKGLKKVNRIRSKLAGKQNAWLYDKIAEVIQRHNRGLTGLEKPVYVSPSLMLKIFESKPKKLSDLRNISGMTETLFKRYGKPLIKVIALDE
tara:strand:+ start:1502 stop:3559 length:2058 start_codon:yes stop_codon:yes gene_type:complete